MTRAFRTISFWFFLSPTLLFAVVIAAINLLGCNAFEFGEEPKCDVFGAGWIASALDALYYPGVLYLGLIASAGSAVMALFLLGHYFQRIVNWWAWKGASIAPPNQAISGDAPKAARPFP